MGGGALIAGVNGACTILFFFAYGGAHVSLCEVSRVVIEEYNELILWSDFLLIEVLDLELTRNPHCRY
jgi:hypothetical protein